MRLTKQVKEELLELLDHIESEDPQVLEKVELWRRKLTVKRGRPKTGKPLERGHRAFMAAESRKYTQEEIFSAIAEENNLSPETIRKDYQAYQKLRGEEQQLADQLMSYLREFNQRMADMAAESRKYTQEEIFSAIAEENNLSPETIRKDYQAYQKLHGEAQQSADPLMSYLREFNQHMADLASADVRPVGKK